MSRAKSIPAQPGQTPSEFLSGATPPPAQMTPPVPVPAPEPPAAVPEQGKAATPPGEIQEFRAPIVPQQAPPPETAAPVAAAAPAPTVPDPFIELHRWTIGVNTRTLRAFPVPGGCLIRLSTLRGTPPDFVQIAESVCFVPNVQVHDGMLLAIESIPPSSKPEPKA